MSGKKSIVVATAFLFAIMIIALVEASPETTISMNPADVKDLETGASFTVDMTITEASDIYGWQLNVTFNPEVLNVSGVAEGPFLKSVNLTAWPIPKIDNNRGYVLFSSSLMPPYPPQGVGGSGTLANITFTVKSGGSSTLHFDTKGTKLRTVEGGVVTPIENYSTQDGAFTGTGGTGLPQFSLEIIAAVVGAVVVVAVAVALFLRRRRQ